MFKVVSAFFLFCLAQISRQVLDELREMRERMSEVRGVGGIVLFVFPLFMLVVSTLNQNRVVWLVGGDFRQLEVQKERDVLFRSKMVESIHNFNEQLKLMAEVCLLFPVFWIFPQSI